MKRWRDVAFYIIVILAAVLLSMYSESLPPHTSGGVVAISKNKVLVPEGEQFVYRLQAGKSRIRYVLRNDGSITTLSDNGFHNQDYHNETLDGCRKIPLMLFTKLTLCRADGGVTFEWPPRSIVPDRYKPR